MARPSLRPKAPAFKRVSIGSVSHPKGNGPKPSPTLSPMAILGRKSASGPTRPKGTI